jgi:hypothetical protein
MTRTKLIDIIRSAFGGSLRIDNLAEYKETYTVGDMTDNTLVPYGLIAGLIPTLGGYEISVTAESGLVIDWQTDIVFGSTTFAEAFGNNLPKPVHYFKDGDTYTNGSVVPVVERIDGDITTVTFDWGYSADCVIVF